MFTQRRHSGGAASAFDPATLFAGGVTGGFWDFTNAATLFSDTGRTTLAVIGGPVNGVTDLSGNGYHLTTYSSPPIRQAGFLDFNSLKFMTASLNNRQVGSAQGFTCAAAARPSDGRNMALIGADYGFRRVAQALHLVNSGVPYCIFFRGDGSTYADASAPIISVAGVDCAASSRVDTAGCAVWGANASQATNGYKSFPGTPASFPNGYLGIGADWQGTNLGDTFDNFVGRYYAALFINRVLTDTELNSLKTYMAVKAGFVYMP